jgi:hypothetical protein
MGLTPVMAGQRLTAALVNNLPVSPATFVTGSSANTTAETVIGSVTVPADDAQYPFGYILRVMCTVDVTGTPTWAPKIHINGIGSTLLASPGPYTCRTATNMQCYIDCPIWVTADGPSGTTSNMAVFTDNVASATVGFKASGASVAALDTTSPWTLVVTGTFGTANAANICRTLAGSLSRA